MNWHTRHAANGLMLGILLTTHALASETHSPTGGMAGHQQLTRYLSQASE